MKVVALLTFRDEAPFLPVWLECASRLVDDIVALDDRSTDGGGLLVEAAGGTVVRGSERSDADGFSARRQVLLELGREVGGTHFLCLDADELPSDPFIRNGRALLSSLEPGASLAVEQINLWRSTTHYRRGWRYRRPLALAFHDDGVLKYEFAAIHETRIPRPAEIARHSLPAGQAAIVHLQFVAWHRAQAKQAWYRCRELLDGRRADAINARYWFTLDSRLVHRRCMPSAWLAEGLDLGGVVAAPVSWHLEEVLHYFDERGAGHFEELQIWQVPELLVAFERSLGRSPRPQHLRIPLIVTATEGRDLLVAGARRVGRTVAR